MQFKRQASVNKRQTGLGRGDSLIFPGGRVSAFQTIGSVKRQSSVISQAEPAIARQTSRQKNAAIPLKKRESKQRGKKGGKKLSSRTRKSPHQKDVLLQLYKDN